MPSNRTRLKRGRRGALTPPERHLLLFGECVPPKGSWRDQGEANFRSFSLVSPAGRGELRALWEANKDQLLSEWTGKGLPWAAKEFD
jgi:hypothetical protein